MKKDQPRKTVYQMLLDMTHSGESRAQNPKASPSDIRREMYLLFLDERGVEYICPKCSGFGVRTYGSTATWRGGIGGQALTQDVCNRCWGSGDDTRPWPPFPSRHQGPASP